MCKVSLQLKAQLSFVNGGNLCRHQYLPQRETKAGQVLHSNILICVCLNTAARTSRVLYAGKEYTKADSRYASRDPFTICMEFVTAFIEGPSCFIIVYGLVSKRAWRHILQLLVVTCQIYGDVLYFATSWYEGNACNHRLSSNLHLSQHIIFCVFLTTFQELL